MLYLISYLGIALVIWFLNAMSHPMGEFWKLGRRELTVILFWPIFLLQVSAEATRQIVNLAMDIPDVMVDIQTEMEKDDSK